MQGPREDTGFKSDANPGIAMVERIYNLCHQAYPKTQVMVSGIRKPEGARHRSATSLEELAPALLASLVAAKPALMSRMARSTVPL